MESEWSDLKGSLVWPIDHGIFRIKTGVLATKTLFDLFNKKRNSKYT